jgi:hypothetical protein
MDLVDTYILACLAIADIALLTFLRRRHRKAACTQRLMRCLESAIRSGAPFVRA